MDDCHFARKASDNKIAWPKLWRAFRRKTSWFRLLDLITSGGFIIWIVDCDPDCDSDAAADSDTEYGALRYYFRRRA